MNNEFSTEFDSMFKKQLLEYVNEMEQLINNSNKFEYRYFQHNLQDDYYTWWENKCDYKHISDEELEDFDWE